jgi:hypothetical protein
MLLVDEDFHWRTGDIAAMCPNPVFEFIDPVFAKTGFINSGTALYGASRDFFCVVYNSGTALYGASRDFFASFIIRAQLCMVRPEIFCVFYIYEYKIRRIIYNFIQ